MKNLADFDLQRVEQALSNVEEAVEDVKSEKEDVEKILEAIDRKFKDLQTAKTNFEESIQLKEDGDDMDAQERLEHAVRRLKEAAEIGEKEASGINEIMELDEQERKLEDSAMKALLNLTDLSETPLDKNPG
jgi:tetratricopeptide (TPR) repeat protein